MIKRWGRVWYGVGIVDTLVLIAIWIITRMPGYPITGRGGMVNEMGIAVEAMQWAFVGVAAARRRQPTRWQRQRIDKRTASDIA